MATTTTDRTLSRHALLAGLGAAIGVGVPLALVLKEYGPGNMWIGFSVGATIAVLGFGLAVWRVRRPGGGTPSDRAFLQVGDERDDALLTRALAVVGLLSLPLTAVATVALAVGLDVLAVMAVLLIVELATLIVAYQVISRRS